MGEVIKNSYNTSTGNRAGKPPRDLINIDKAIQLRLKNNMSYQEIADYFNVTKQSVFQALRPYVGSHINVKAVESNLTDILKLKRAEVLTNLTMAKQKDMSGLQLITGAGILTDKIRLEEGKSTSNIAMQDINSEVSNLQKEREALEAELDNL